MIRIIGLSCVLLAAFGSQALAGNCRVPFIRTLAGQTVQGTMFAVSGKRCSIVLTRSKGPTFGTKLVSSPSNGSVSISGNRIVYVSRSGFVGEDHLSYARVGQDTLNHPITRTVDLTVKVSEHL
jgi:hypothetical protein